MVAKLPDEIITQMHSEYMSGLRMLDVALAHGYKSESTLCYHFKQRNLFTRPRGGAIKASQKGHENGNWKGGRVIKTRGYILVWQPNHSRAEINGYVPEHILVAEKSLGRPIEKGEIVHHINKDTHDNRHENLLVTTQSNHINIHREDLQKCKAQS
uniref:Putative homing endonuclease n=1 Tax=viral metagenome TaxID=1070528 RepID=A0A6M3IR05_9ZZZZ